MEINSFEKSRKSREKTSQKIHEIIKLKKNHEKNPGDKKSELIRDIRKNIKIVKQKKIIKELMRYFENQRLYFF